MSAFGAIPLCGTFYFLLPLSFVFPILHIPSHTASGCWRCSHPGKDSCNPEQHLPTRRTPL